MTIIHRAIDKATKKIESMGGTILAFAVEPDNINEGILYQVVAKFDTEYIVWLYNAEFNGLTSGYYIDSARTAYEIFYKRLER